MTEVTNYSISELNMRYNLSGKFQTDNLKARFGQYRQVFDCEKTQDDIG